MWHNNVYFCFCLFCISLSFVLISLFVLLCVFISIRSSHELLNFELCKMHTKEEDGYLPAATARARSTKDVHPGYFKPVLLNPRGSLFADIPSSTIASANRGRHCTSARIFNAHSSPPLSRFTRNFFKLEIFSDDAARPKISHTKIYQTKILLTKKRQITVCCPLSYKKRFV